MIGFVAICVVCAVGGFMWGYGTGYENGKKYRN